MIHDLNFLFDVCKSLMCSYCDCFNIKLVSVAFLQILCQNLKNFDFKQTLQIFCLLSNETWLELEKLFNSVEDVFISSNYRFWLNVNELRSSSQILICLQHMHTCGAVAQCLSGRLASQRSGVQSPAQAYTISTNISCYKYLKYFVVVSAIISISNNLIVLRDSGLAILGLKLSNH